MKWSIKERKKEIVSLVLVDVNGNIHISVFQSIFYIFSYESKSYFIMAFFFSMFRVGNQTRRGQSIQAFVLKVDLFFYNVFIIFHIVARFWSCAAVIDPSFFTFSLPSISFFHSIHISLSYSLRILSMLEFIFPGVFNWFSP